MKDVTSNQEQELDQDTSATNVDHHNGSSLTVDPMIDMDHFAGHGEYLVIEDLDSVPLDKSELSPPHHKKLGQLKATSICGNDITSSCLYVSAICALYAGPYAPLCLAFVALVLYLFRNIYAEVGSALPLNGGAYNVLLNTTTKSTASVAACLTLLSYIATAVISAYEAMHYAHDLFPQIHVISATILLLGAFAFLNLLGISESATVATIIFITHMSVLTLLVLASGVVALQDWSVLIENMHTPPPSGTATALFFGFAAGMLGISGFESSANFIEEQRPGVFVKTLRNMWTAVAIFNPLISFLTLALIPLSTLEEHKETLLAELGRHSALPILSHVVSIDAVLVLSGAVLTSFVGVTGLVRRMSLDRCLPQFLLQENRWRHTNHWIIILFFALCSSILLITKGHVKVLAGVYTLSFLGVMALFAVGNLLLKAKRGRLPRAVRASWPSVLAGLLAVLAGIAGNIIVNPKYVAIFSIYFLLTGTAVTIMFLRIKILKGILFISHSIAQWVTDLNQEVLRRVNKAIDVINSQTVIYFSKGDHLANLNRAALYVLQNEQTRRLMVVHVHKEGEPVPPTLHEHLKFIDEEYPELRVDYVEVTGTFGPELIHRLSKRLGVPKNYMFIGTPGNRFPHNIAELGGVRLIL